MFYYDVLVNHKEVSPGGIMLTKIKRADIPEPGGKPKSKMRIFAHKTLQEFVETTEIGDIVEITEFPVVCEDECANADRLINALSAEIRFINCEDKINRFRRKGRVFIERKEQFIPKKRKPNPYPYD